MTCSVGLVIPLVIPHRTTRQDQAALAGRPTRPDQREWHAAPPHGRSWVDFQSGALPLEGLVSVPGGSPPAITRVAHLVACSRRAAGVQHSAAGRNT
jgi:hypothetical protein